MKKNFPLSNLKKLWVLLCIFSFHAASAQKEFNIWYFGFNAGVDFNSGSPVVLSNGALYTYEGCASIADANGILQFYTDGITVYNRNHLAMPNGSFVLLGGSSSTQSANILPVVGSPGQYYIFTTGNAGVNVGFHYSIVDMSLQGGLGDVTAQNVWLMDSVVEGQTIIPHPNGTDYWVISHKFGTSDYYSYLVNASGIQAPVISTTGTYIGNATNYDQIGYIKPSPCGNKIVYANTGGNFFDLSDFDNNTGILSGTITLPSTAGAAIGCYGAEFSPDGHLLYGGVNGTGDIYQFDLTAGSAAAIIASRTLIGIGSGSNLGGLQLAPDNKIYIGRYSFGYLGVINNPNTLGVGCNYVDSGFYLNGLNTCWGLPGHYGNIWCNLSPVAIFNAPNHICPGTCTDFINLSQNATSYLWTFNGGTPSTSTDVNPTNICYNSPGTYSVTLIAMSAGGSDTLHLNNFITVYPYPAAQGITQSGDTLIANPGAVSYQWYLNGVLIPGATNYLYLAMMSGNYNVVATDVNGCEVEAVIFDVIASVRDFSADELSALVYPNPVESILTLDLSKLPILPQEISLYNVAAEKIFSVVPDGTNNQSTIQMDMNAFAKGVYWLEIKMGGKVFRKELLKK